MATAYQSFLNIRNFSIGSKILKIIRLFFFYPEFFEQPLPISATFTALKKTRIHCILHEPMILDENLFSLENDWDPIEFDNSHMYHSWIALRPAQQLDFGFSVPHTNSNTGDILELECTTLNSATLPPNSSSMFNHFSRPLFKVLTPESGEDDVDGLEQLTSELFAIVSSLQSEMVSLQNPINEWQGFSQKWKTSFGSKTVRPVTFTSQDGRELRYSCKTSRLSKEDSFTFCIKQLTMVLQSRLYMKPFSPSTL